MSNEKRKRVAIRFTFVVGIIIAIQSVIGVIIMLNHAPLSGEDSILYFVIIPIIFSLIPLIAAFISRKNMGAAGIILVILGLYNIIGDIYFMSITFHSMLIITNLPDVFILIAGILCLTAKGAKNTVGTNPKKTIRDFDTVDNINEIIQNWAKKTGFSKGNPLMKKTMNIDNNTYCYHSLAMGSCTYITINLADDKVHMEAWIEYDLIFRLLTIFIVPKQQRLDIKSPVGLVERLLSKRKLSKLLEVFGEKKL